MILRPFLSRTLAAFFVIILATNVSEVSASKNSDKIQFKTENTVIDFGGKATEETYFANNLTLLNKSIAQDSTFMLRTTMDYFASINYNERIMCYNAMRFRFRWGTDADTRSANSNVKIADTTLTVPGTTTNKHLVWLRESWLKIQLGSFKDLNNFIQIGLIPFQVGRGISLGAAFDAQGFITFIPGSAINQYAPSMLLSLNPIADRLTFDIYGALARNHQGSLSSNLANVRQGLLDGCSQRGVGMSSYIVALRADVLAYKKGEHKVNVEPYLVHKTDPDITIEFANDANNNISTAGMSVEGVFNKFNWGMEGACNFGLLSISPWDRNRTMLAKDDNGFIVEEYTKIYTQDPAIIPNPDSALVTADIAQFLKTIPQTTAYNGKYLGTVDGTPLYQAFSRIRPAQAFHFSGFFFTSDATYIVLPKTLELSLSVGYASGYSDCQDDANTDTAAQLMNKNFTGFVPMQSVYYGKRVRHLIAFADGLPRFSVHNPDLDDSKYNILKLQTPGLVNIFTNIAFIGGRIEWNPYWGKSHNLNFSPNIIAYWAPEETQKPGVKDGFHAADNALGIELNTEFSMYFYKKLKLSGYFGVFVPGQHYKDLCGTIVPQYNLPTGADAGYAGNVNISYVF